MTYDSFLYDQSKRGPSQNVKDPQPRCHGPLIKGKETY